MSTLAEMLIKISADASSLNKTITGATDELSKFASKAGAVGGVLTGALTLPIVGFGAAAVKVAADFEQGMSNVKAVSGATGKEMEDLKKLALKMGADTKYSAKEAATGIEELMKAGLTTEQVLKGGLKGALSLAAAGGIELADAAEISATALNAFKSDALTVQNAADLLAGAANASATSVGELKYSLSASASVASAVGMSFKDTTTALAVFAQNGLKGSDAGTSLKTMMMNLQPQTDKQIQLFKQLGLTTAAGGSAFFDSAGKLKSLNDISKQLNVSFKDMNQAQRLAAMETMFGSDAIRAANILFKEGAVDSKSMKTGVESMAAAMAKVGADQTAAIKMQNLNGAMEQLKGSLETLMIQIGSLFLPYLTQVSTALTSTVNGLMDMDKGTQIMIISIAGIVAAIGPVLLVIAGLASGLSAVGGALAVIVSPIGLVVIAVGALVAALVYLWNTNKDFKNFVISIWNEMYKVAMDIFGGLKAFWDQWGATIIKAFVTTWNFIKSVFYEVFKNLGSSLSTFFQSISPVWEAIKKLFESLMPVFNLMWSIIKPILVAFGVALGVMWTIAISVFAGIIKAVGPFVEGIISAITAIVNIFNMFGALLKGDFPAAWEFFKKAVGNIVNMIKSYLVAFGNYFVGFGDMFVGVLKGVGIDVTSVWEGIKATFKNSINFIIGLVNSFIGFFNNIKISVPGVNIPGVGNIGGFSIGMPQIPKIPMLASGTNYVPNDTLAMIHKGEAVVPKKYNSNGGQGNVIQIILDGRVIQQYIDDGLGSKLVSAGVF